jgi:hypothetical protein
MPRHVQDGDAGPALAPPETIDDVRLLFGFRPSYPGVQVIALFKIDVDLDVVAAYHPAERTCATPHVNAAQPGHITRLRKQLIGDVLEVLQLLGQRIVRVAGGHLRHARPPLYRPSKMYCTVACNRSGSAAKPLNWLGTEYDPTNCSTERPDALAAFALSATSL